MMAIIYTFYRIDENVFSAHPDDFPTPPTRALFFPADLSDFRTANSRARIRSKIGRPRKVDAPPKSGFAKVRKVPTYTLLTNYSCDFWESLEIAALTQKNSKFCFGNYGRRRVRGSRRKVVEKVIFSCFFRKCRPRMPMF